MFMTEGGRRVTNAIPERWWGNVREAQVKLDRVFSIVRGWNESFWNWAQFENPKCFQKCIWNASSLLGCIWIVQQWKQAQLQTAPRSASAVNTLLLQRHINFNQLQSKDGSVCWVHWSNLEGNRRHPWLKRQGSPGRLTGSVKTWLCYSARQCFHYSLSR